MTAGAFEHFAAEIARRIALEDRQRRLARTVVEKPRRAVRTRRVEQEFAENAPDTRLKAGETFGFRRVIIVSQRYHLYRALYIADRAGLEAYGVTADPRTYSGQAFRELREVAARVKDFFQCMFRI